jgi:hypothetical protein
MDRSFLQFTIYAVGTLALALWRVLPGLLVAAGFLGMLALCEHSSTILQHIFTR